MSIELTVDQLKATSHGPLHITDPATNEAYVVLTLGDFALLQTQTEDDFDPREAYPLIDKIMAEDDANDPHLESYQKYGKQP
jgi:hypothetical protein